MKNIKSITVLAGDYPAPGHMMLVFVQQLVHAFIGEGIMVNVVASQSIVHALVHGEKLVPRHMKAVTEKGIEYDIYRPYTLTFGNSNPFKFFTDWYNRHVIEKRLRKIGGDVFYAHFWENALPIYKYALANNIPMFVACGEGDNALEDMVAKMTKDDLSHLARACWGVISVSSENRRKCINFGLSKVDDIEVFPNCVNTDLFHKMVVTDMKKKLGIGDDDFVISFVGGSKNVKDQTGLLKP